MPVLSINGVTFVTDRYGGDVIHINWTWVLKLTLYTGIEQDKEETYLEVRDVKDIKVLSHYEEFDKYPIVAVINVKNIKNIKFFDVDGSEGEYTF
jgi:hypothetical protein